MGSAAQKFQNWKRNHPAAYHRWAERQVKRRRKRGYDQRFHIGRRGEWAVWRLFDPAGEDGDLPRAVVAARADSQPERKLWANRNQIDGACGRWLRTLEAAPRSERLISGISRRLALALASAETRRVKRVLGVEWVGLHRSGGLRGIASRLMGWRCV